MRCSRLFLTLGVCLWAAACANTTDEEEMGGSEEQLSSSRSFVAKGTGYYPDSSALEGGFVDRKGAKLRTLQQFLAGRADYVSVAMDANAFKYGQRLRIQELNAKYGKDIVFRVVDTGGAFRGKGTKRIDICTANQKASLDPTINGTLHIDVVDSSTALPPATPPPASPPPATPPPATSPPANPSGGGTACSSDGACNPGNDGSGLICVNSRCVPGCHTDANCPGVTTCNAGQCN